MFGDEFGEVLFGGGSVLPEAHLDEPFSVLLASELVDGEVVVLHEDAMVYDFLGLPQSLFGLGEL